MSTVVEDVHPRFHHRPLPRLHHVGNFLLSCAEEDTSPSTTGGSAKHPEGEQQQYTQEAALPLLSSSSTLHSASGGSTGSCDTVPHTPGMTYPVSEMRNESFYRGIDGLPMESVTSTAAFNTSGHTSDAYHQSTGYQSADDDVFMHTAEPCSTSTPIARTPDSFMDSMDQSSDNMSPFSNTTNITTPSTTSGSAFKPKSRYRPSQYHTKPTFCPFFSSPHVQYAERTRELWKHRLELARRRAMSLSGGIPGAAHLDELKRKAPYIRRMGWIESVTWELPSEFEQYMFLLKLQAEEGEREVRREEEMALRSGEDPSSDSEGSTFSDCDEAERSTRVLGNTGDWGYDERCGYPEPPPSQDIVEFGRAREFEMKMRLEELHKNAKAFSIRPLFEEASIFDQESGDISEVDADRGIVQMSYI